jgi:hypothetical protein
MQCAAREKNQCEMHRRNNSPVKLVVTHILSQGAEIAKDSGGQKKTKVLGNLAQSGIAETGTVRPDASSGQ